MSKEIPSEYIYQTEHNVYVEIDYYAKQTSEMQKDIDELKHKLNQQDELLDNELTASVHHAGESEYQQIVINKQLKEIIELTNSYTTLKQSADEMANTLELLKTCTNYNEVKIYIVNNPNHWTCQIDKALKNYKKLI